jgi:hypothetical protein
MPTTLWLGLIWRKSRYRWQNSRPFAVCILHSARRPSSADLEEPELSRVWSGFGRPCCGLHDMYVSNAIATPTDHECAFVLLPARHEAVCAVLFLGMNTHTSRRPAGAAKATKTAATNASVGRAVSCSSAHAPYPSPSGTPPRRPSRPGCTAAPAPAAAQRGSAARRWRGHGMCDARPRLRP